MLGCGGGVAPERITNPQGLRSRLSDKDDLLPRIRKLADLLGFKIKEPSETFFAKRVRETPGATLSEKVKTVATVESRHVVMTVPTRKHAPIRFGERASAMLNHVHEAEELRRPRPQAERTPLSDKERQRLRRWGAEALLDDANKKIAAKVFKDALPYIDDANREEGDAD